MIPPRACSLLAGLAFLLGAPGSAQAADKTTRLRDFPCAGCVTDLPPGEEAVSLVVVLHGDEGSPGPVVLPRWAQAAEQAGYALLAPRCPRDHGCRDGSWWRWAGDPSWLKEQVEKVRARRPIASVDVVGWSGGSSYLGNVAPLLKGFDGVALCGGGIPPISEACVSCPPPVYFVAGSANPLHHLEVASRDAFLACKHEVQWDFLRGKDHAGELDALTPERTRTILGWLRDHRRSCAPAPGPSASATREPPPAPTLAFDAPPLPSAPPAASMAPPANPPNSRCTCGVPGQSRGGEAGALLVGILGGIARLVRMGRRRSRKS